MKHHFRLILATLFLVPIISGLLFTSATGALANVKSNANADQVLEQALVQRLSPQSQDIAIPSEWIAFVDRTNNIVLVRPDQSETIKVTTNGGDKNLYYSPKWSPDGTRLAYIREEVKDFSLGQDNIFYLYVYDLEAQTHENLYSGASFYDFYFDWSPDGDHILYNPAPVRSLDNQTMKVQIDNPGLKLIDVKSKETIPFVNGIIDQFIDGVDWSEKGGYIGFDSCIDSPQVPICSYYVVSVADRQIDEPIVTGDYYTGRWMPKHEFQVLISHTCRTPMECGAPFAIKLSLDKDPPAVLQADATDYWSRSETWLANPLNNRIDLLDSNNNMVKQVPTQGSVFEIDWHGSETWLIFLENKTIKLLNIETGDIIPVTEARNQIYKYPTLDWQPAIPQPEEGWIAYLQPDGNVALISPDGVMTQQLTRDAQVKQIAYGNLSWSSDGRYLGIRRTLDEKELADFLVYDSHTQRTFTAIEGLGITDFWYYTWLPDDSSIAYSRNAIGELFNPSIPGVWRLQLDGQHEALVPSTQEHADFANLKTSPDGKWLHYNVPSIEGIVTTGLVDLRDPASIIDFNRSGIWNCIWSADSSMLTCVENKQMVLLDLEGKLVRAVSVPMESVHNIPIAWSQNGYYLAYQTITSVFSDRASMIVMNQSDKFIYQGEGLPTSWSPDGSKLLVTDLSQIFILDENDWQRSVLAEGSHALWQPREIPPPDAITDLSILVAHYGEGEINLPGAPISITLTVPGSLFLEVTPVTEIEVRFNTEPLTIENWDESILILKETEELRPGTKIQWRKILPSDYFSKQLYFSSRSRNSFNMWSGLSNEVKLLDSGFRADKDGYYFNNADELWNSMIRLAFTPDDVRVMFGDEACLPNPVQNAPCELTDKYKMWYETVLGYSLGGQCTGMAVSSQLLYYDPNQYNTFTTPDRIIYSEDVNLLDQQPRKIIITNHVKQFAMPILKYKFSTNTPVYIQQPSEVLSEVREYIINKIGIDLEVGKMVDDKSIVPRYVWHSITPIAIIENPGAPVKLIVYNNAYKRDHHLIIVDIENETWEYGLISGSGDIKDNHFKFVPMEMFTGDQEFPTGANYILFIFSGTTGSYLENTEGQRTGLVDGNELNEIPEAGLIPITGESIPLQPAFAAPPGQKYTFHLQPVLDGSIASTFLSGFLESSSFMIDQIQLSSDTDDILSFGGDENQITYQPQGNQEVNWSFSKKQADNRDYSVRIDGFEIEAGISASLEWGENQTSLKITTAAEGSYKIEIHRFTADQADIFTFSEVAMQPGQTHIYDLANWDGVGKISIGIDKNQDGKPERTLRLKNEYEGAVATSKENTPSPGMIGIGVGMLVCGVVVLFFGSSRLRKELSR